MNRDQLRQITVILTLAITLAVNALANILPFNGVTTGQVSDSFKVFFVPAGYVFSIWSLIYALLIGNAVYQALPAQRANARLRASGWWLAAANLVNAGWMFAWHFGYYPLSLGIMLALLVILIVLYVRLAIGKREQTGAQRWLVDLPVSVYLGWITVATVANATSALYHLGWNGFGLDPRLWAVIMIGVASLLGGLMAVTRRDAAYLLVLAWAFAGIGVKFPAEGYLPVAAWIGSVLALVLAIGSFRAANLQKNSPQKAIQGVAKEIN